MEREVDKIRNCTTILLESNFFVRFLSSYKITLEDI